MSKKSRNSKKKLQKKQRFNKKPAKFSKSNDAKLIAEIKAVPEISKNESLYLAFWQYLAILGSTIFIIYLLYEIITNYSNVESSESVSILDRISLLSFLLSFQAPIFAWCYFVYIKKKVGIPKIDKQRIKFRFLIYTIFFISFFQIIHLITTQKYKNLKVI